MEETKLLRLSYLMLQRLSNSSVLIAIETDALRAQLRNKISEIEGMDCEQLQNETEHMASLNPIR